jgi:phosphoglucosamine mutase
VVTTLPQVLVNVPGVDRDRTDDPELAAAVAVEQDKLGETGRILLRPSGTEPVVRVMVEAADEDTAQRHAGALAEVVRTHLALSGAPVA